MISVSGASEATGDAVASAASWAATEGGGGGVLSFCPCAVPDGAGAQGGKQT